MNRNERILYGAAGELGVQEWKKGSNPRIELYLNHGASLSNKKSGLVDGVAWCAAFVAFVLEAKAGMTSTNSLMARSYEKWGRSSKSAPLPGDIVTFYRGTKSQGLGHVAFLLKYTSDFVWCLGGNQGDEVSIVRYSTERMTDIRRSSLEFNISETQKKKLISLANKILNGQKISESGKVT